MEIQFLMPLLWWNCHEHTNQTVYQVLETSRDPKEFKSLLTENRTQTPVPGYLQSIWLRKEFLFTAAQRMKTATSSAKPLTTRRNCRRKSSQVGHLGVFEESNAKPMLSLMACEFVPLSFSVDKIFGVPVSYSSPSDSKVCGICSGDAWMNMGGHCHETKPESLPVETTSKGLQLIFCNTSLPLLAWSWLVVSLWSLYKQYSVWTRVYHVSVCLSCLLLGDFNKQTFQ